MKIGVIIGRFNPVHTGHYKLFNKALEENDKIIIVIGSAYCAPSPKNPLSFQERVDLIRLGFLHLTQEMSQRIVYKFVVDTPYSDLDWVSNITKAVSFESAKNDTITLYGCEKDPETTQYLSMFPLWKRHIMKPLCNLTNNPPVISATYVRHELFSKGLAIFDTTLAGIYNDAQRLWLERWICSDEFHNIQKDFEYYEHYKKLWQQSAPFPPIFVTCDAIVTCNNHILLIRRKKNPGANQLAMPGGFLNTNETIRSGILRELCEETRLQESVPLRVLDAKLSDIKTFDFPKRSLRGRVITNVGVIKLTEKQLPTVIAADDAKEAFWVPIMNLSQMSSGFFEDHYHIITSYL